MPISKKVSKKTYYFYDKYYTKEEALKKALVLKYASKQRGEKMRTYIEEVKEFGSLSELLIPNTKFYLWING